MKQFNTKRIQYNLYINGEYCFYEIENLGTISTHEVEEISALVFSVIPDDFLMKMRHIRMIIDSGKGVSIYFTTASNVPEEVFEMLKDKFFERIFVCKEDVGVDVYVGCFRHK
jgi:hypothetical protein